MSIWNKKKQNEPEGLPVGEEQELSRSARKRRFKHGA